MNESKKPYLRPHEVAELLRCGARAVWGIPKDRLPYTITPGGRVKHGHRRYLKIDVERYIAELNEDHDAS